jgi:hypothetical protein
MTIGAHGRRPVLFLIDVEPDARKTLDGAGGWAGSDAAIEHLEHLRLQLEEATGATVQFNWFLRADPQIQQTWGRADWVAEACPRIIRTIADRGDYCGIHPHLWRWHAQRRAWFNELNDPAWTSECLHTAVDAYKRIFGSPPEACRFGDRCLNQRAVELLRERSIRYDLTIEPGMADTPIHDDPHATGWLPDYRFAHREPYVPSSENFLVPTKKPADSASLWMIPLTTTVPAWRLVRRPPYLLKASRSPNLALSSSYVWPHIRDQIEEGGDAPLSMVLRSGDLTNRAFLRNFLRTTSELVRHPMLGGCEFTNPATAIARWQTVRR